MVPGAPQDRRPERCSVSSVDRGPHVLQPASQGGSRLPAARIMTGCPASPEFLGAMANELCAAGLWVETADGFQDPRLPQDQPSQEEGPAQQSSSGTDAQNENVGKTWRSMNRTVKTAELRRNFLRVHSSPVPSRIPNPTDQIRIQILMCLRTIAARFAAPAAASCGHTKKPTEAQVRDQTALILFAELNQARLGVVSGSRSHGTLNGCPGRFEGLSGAGYTRTKSGA